MNDLASAIAGLRSRWHTLHDLDRAQEVRQIHQAGVSLAKLARELNCSPSLLSRLALAAKASPEDLEEARRAGMSIRELARRAQSNESPGSFRNPEAIAFETERAAVKGSQGVARWLDSHEVPQADQERVIEQAFLQLVEVQHRAQAEKADMLTRKIDDMLAINPGRQSRRGRVEFNPEDSVTWTALWLAHWIVRNVPDGRIRIRALELAAMNIGKPAI